MNFLLVFGGSAFFGLTLTNYVNEQKINHPVLHASLQKLATHDLLIQLLGHPVQYFNSYQNRVFLNDQIYDAQVLVKGPKGSIRVDIHAEALPFSHTKDKSGYLIPDPELRLKIQEADARQTIDPKDKFWKVTHVRVDLGDQDHALVVVPEKDKVSHETLETYGDVVAAMSWKDPTDYESLNEIEKEEIRRFRQAQFYNQIRGVRVMQFGSALFLGMFAFQYSKKYRRLPIQGTSVHSSVLHEVQKHPEVIRTFGAKLALQQTIRGAMYHNHFKFEQDFIYKGQLGTIMAEGEKQREIWKISELQVKQKEKGQYTKAIKII